MTAAYFGDTGIRIENLAQWLDAASGVEGASPIPPIVLPMIQRGSVWKPHQVMDLWDTLLRGLPVGSMMASMTNGDTASDTGRDIGSDRGQGHYISPITREMRAIGAKGALSLLDGQQRTLAMLLAWPAAGDTMTRRVWIDLGMDDSHDHLFRFHVTTEYQPFGTQLAGPSGQAVGKLARDDRRKALAVFEAVHGALPRQATGFAQRKALLWQRAVPWHATIPVDLRCAMHAAGAGDDNLRAVIAAAHAKQRGYWEEAQRQMPESLRATVAYRLDRLNAVDPDAIDRRIARLARALAAFRTLHLPVIKVPDSAFAAPEDAEGEGSGSVRDPVLAVLFQRIGTGGTALSNADYVFSILKHRNPDCHNLVQAALRDQNIAALFAPVTLVTTAVRLTAAQLEQTDAVAIDKQQFARLMHSPNFVDTFNANIATDGPFLSRLRLLLDTLRYRADRPADIGFPLHALCLIDVRVVEVMLRWMERADIGEADAERNRHGLIRFALYWALGVTDRERASAALFKLLAEADLARDLARDLPERQWVQWLLDQPRPVALPLCPLAAYETDPILRKMVQCPEPGAGDNQVLRDWQRFDVKWLNRGEGAPDGPIDTDTQTGLEQAVALYRRFANTPGQHWNYRHTLLLWLQRHYVAATFEDAPALPGAEDETPYDYDHICPANHWSGWTGQSKDHNPSVLPFYRRDRNEAAEHWIGNSIGNVRVWDSSENRSLSDASPRARLDFDDKDHGPQDRRNSAFGIDAAELDAWKAYSASDEADPRHWDRDRAVAFQRAIERRTFNLFRQFHTDLDFAPYAPGMSEQA